MTYHIVLDALGEPTRRLLFDRLCLAPCSVAALAAGLSVTRPAVSQHLKILRAAGLVGVQAVGTRHVYRVEGEGLASLRAWLDRLRDDVLDAHRAEIQRQLDERK
ncbi:MAG: ArsR/SmtB family transcription factor, partial [Rhizomicrobium sp.]